MPQARIDLTNRIFGRLSVIKLDDDKTASTRKTWWVCECSCGNSRSFRADQLTRGVAQSCGCRNREAVTKLGGVGTPEYSVWSGILKRCFNPNSELYKNYGGRGITIAPEWKNDFGAFLSHIGPRRVSSALY